MRPSRAIEMLAVGSAGLHVIAFLLEAVGAAGDVSADVVHFVRPPAPAEKLCSSIDSKVALKIVRRLAVVSDQRVAKHDSGFGQCSSVLFEHESAVNVVRPCPFVNGHGSSN